MKPLILSVIIYVLILASLIIHYIYPENITLYAMAASIAVIFFMIRDAINISDE